MTTNGLTYDQVWITAEGARLYGKEAELYLQPRIRSLNRMCRSAQRLMRGIESELKQHDHTNNRILYALSTDEMLAHIAICCEMLRRTAGDAALTGPSPFRFHKKNRLFYQTASWRINLFGVPRDPRLFHFDFEASPEKFRSPRKNGIFRQRMGITPFFSLPI